MKTQTNCNVLQVGSKAGDHSHVRTSAPIDVKRRELSEIPRSKREIETTKIRAKKSGRGN
jgi:hypothetical protein